MDCAGTPNGTAAVDACGACVGGTTGLLPCALSTRVELPGWVTVGELVQGRVFGRSAPETPVSVTVSIPTAAPACQEANCVPPEEAYMSFYTGPGCTGEELYLPDLDGQDGAVYACRPWDLNGLCGTARLTATVYSINIDGSCDEAFPDGDIYPGMVRVYRPPHLNADGLFTWKPAAADVGSHEIVVTTADGMNSAVTRHVVTVSALAVQATATLTAAGGELVVTDPTSPIFGARLTVPAGALTQDTTLSIAVATTPPPDDGTPVGVAVELLPSGQEFLVPVTLQLPFNVATLPPGVDTSQLHIHQFVPAALHTGGGRPWDWSRLTTTVDLQASALTAQLNHFSTYRVRALSLLLWGYYVTPHFVLEYRNSGTSAPLPDARYVNGGLVAYRADVPDYVEDLGAYLEAAWDWYQQQGWQPAARYTVTLKDLGDNLGEALGEQHTPSLYIHNTMRKTDPTQRREELRTTAAHELFHLLQFRRLAGVTDWWGVRLRSWFNNTMWLTEATATFMSYEVFPQPGGGQDYINARLLMDEQMQADSTGGYATFVLFKFLKQHYSGTPAANLVWTMFNPVDGDLRYNLFESGRDYMYRSMAELVPGENAALHDFALGYQYLRRNSWVEDVEFYLGAPTAVTRPTGDETDMTRRRVLPSRPPPGDPLVPGGVQSYALDLSNVTNLAQRVVVITPTVEPGLHGLVRKVDRNQTIPSPVTLATIQGPGAVRLDGAALNVQEQLVVTVVNDSYNRASARVAVEVHFESRDAATMYPVNGPVFVGQSFGQAVTPVPTVRLVDQVGSPVANATVTWTVIEGGGTVGNATTQTDALGQTNVGSWTLGPGGAQVLRAAAQGSGLLPNPPSATFLAACGGNGQPGCPCIPPRGVDDILSLTNCCSGSAVPGSGFCLNPEDWGTTWATCYQTCE